MSRAPLFAPLAVVLLAFVPACAKRAPEPSAEVPPAVVIAPEPAAEPSTALDAMEVFVFRGAGNAWGVQYPAGQRVLLGGQKLTDVERAAVGKMVLPVNKPVKITFTSEGTADVFAIPAFPLEVRVPVGRYTAVTMKPVRAGEFELRDGNGRFGAVLVVSATEFDDWLLGIGPLHGQTADEPPATAGQKLFLKLQCIQCHSAKPDAKGPVLEGLYGTRVALKGGGAEIADDAYIIESIRRPRLKVVEGWEAIMPAYDESQVSVEELNALVAYIRSLKRGQTPDPKERFPAPVGAPTERPKETAPPPREK